MLQATPQRSLGLPALLAASIFALSLPVFADEPTPVTLDAKVISGFIKNHCAACHGATTQEGKRRLDNLSLHLTDSEIANSWQEVYTAIKSGKMPPEGQPGPGTTQSTAVLKHLESNLRVATKQPGPAHQYHSGDIAILAASADEPKVKTFNQATVLAASKYLDDGAVAWTRERKCITCHTNGTYMVERPSLSKYLGPPNEEVSKPFRSGLSPTLPVPKSAGYPNGYKIIWRTLGLAQWDKYVTGETSKPTDTALRSMLLQQRDDGSWNHYRGVREIPHITTEFGLVVRAAWAVSAAPGWLDNLKDDDLNERVANMKSFLRDHKPRNDYEVALKLQLANFMPDAVSPNQRQQAIAMLRRKQQTDGGWSTRSMSEIENWAPKMEKRLIEMLRSETETQKTASDPYMTGFAIVLLREAGVPQKDGQIQRGINWLKSNQRESGRWWMKSMFKDTYHFSTYLGTAQALKALALCGELTPRPQPAATVVRPAS